MTSPTITSATTQPPKHAHTSVGGFCGICGAVWPCKQATADATPVNHIPVPRW